MPRNSAPAAAPLADYNAKRDFGKTAEPAGTLARPGKEAQLLFVVQKHWASRLHYDFRLELDGVMLSWAVPKGPSFDPAVKSLAIQVEDHPVSYNSFEGEIPKGQYGGGTVIVWDHGTWVPVGDPRAGLAKGKLVFALDGHKLAGLWELVRISKAAYKKQNQWLLFKKRDAWARPKSEYEVITALPESVIRNPLGRLSQREPRAQPTPVARKAPLPATLEPQLATLVAEIPAGRWLVESKFDGYRVLVRIEGDAVQIFTRNGNDWTRKLRPLAQTVGALGVTRAWLDGEIVVLDDNGVPNLHRLQNAIDSAQASDIVLFAFDIPYLGDSDLRDLPLRARRELLQQLLEGRESAQLRLSQVIDATPDELLSAACKLGLEGVMVKNADAPYVSGRTESWLKLKCQLRQEFVVLGYTPRTGAARDIGSLLLGYYEDGVLHGAGAVGTGWDSVVGRQLHDLLQPLEIAQCPAAAMKTGSGRWPRRKAGSERWVTPAVVVEVAFGAWTPDHQVRHAVFRGLRTDKPVHEVVREYARKAEARHAPAPKPARAAARSAVRTDSSPVTVTHGQRIIDPSTGLRKIDLVRYYEGIAQWMLPHLKQRPVSLVRAPSGIAKALFFQKHAEGRLTGIQELDPALWPEHAPLLGVDTAQALAGAAQMNVIELHTWNSKVARIDRPDRFVLDLDPGEGVDWEMLVEAAGLTRVMLTELGLQSWLKTSGGKGLHVVVPITPRRDFAQVKAFTQALVKHMARVIPSKFVAVAGDRNRVGKIFIDYLRNGQGQTTVAAFSARARPGMGVSMPISWEQLPQIGGGAHWTVRTALNHLQQQKDDPWSGYWKSRQTITEGLRRLK